MPQQGRVWGDTEEEEEEEGDASPSGMGRCSRLTDLHIFETFTCKIGKDPHVCKSIQLSGCFAHRTSHKGSATGTALVPHPGTVPTTR